MRALFLEIDADQQWAVASIGPAFLAACARERGHEVEMLRVAPQDPAALVLERIQSRAPDLLALSLTTRQWMRARALVEELRRSCALPLIAGGLHPTFSPEEVLESPGFDAICLGEGEEAFVEVLDALESDGRIDASPIANLWVKGGERPPLRPVIEPLDRIPFMARDLLDEHEGVIHMCTQRGCPFPCTYCAARKFNDLYADQGDYGRRRSHEHVLQEMEAVRDASALHYVIFLDDTFTIDPHWVRAFCPLHRDRIGVPFSLHARVETVDESMLSALADAGCRHITYGVESGSLRLRREVMKRPVANERFEKVFRWTKARGILTTANYMLGLPEETAEDLQATLELHQRLEPDDFGYFVFYPYPGTHLFDLCRERGYLPENYRELPARHRSSILRLPTLTQEEIGRAYDEFTRLRIADYERKYGHALGPEGLEEVKRSFSRSAEAN